MKKLNTLAVLSLFYYVSLYALEQSFIPKYGPLQKPYATLLKQSPTFIQKTPAMDYWALSPYYVGMLGGHSASAASVTMVLNALRQHTSYSSSDELIQEPGLLKNIPAEKWLNLISGEKPRGVSLEELAANLRLSLPTYKLDLYKVEVIHIDDLTESTLKLLRKTLKENESSDKNYLIANYLQSAFTNDPEGAVGTYSPVAAFDSKNDRVLIFETDRKYYEPYWVSLKTFCEGLLNLKNASTQKPTGGLLWIHL